MFEAREGIRHSGLPTSEQFEGGSADSGRGVSEDEPQPQFSRAAGLPLENAFVLSYPASSFDMSTFSGSPAPPTSSLSTNPSSFMKRANYATSVAEELPPNELSVVAGSSLTVPREDSTRLEVPIFVRQRRPEIGSTEQLDVSVCAAGDLSPENRPAPPTSPTGSAIVKFCFSRAVVSYREDSVCLPTAQKTIPIVFKWALSV
ncbi:unnamed protein product [Dibothriocephalus latus]|uniref:Uncharacterized protein n=1 Tax=Dibothriocephalus latus TaxID=60516 RepID=A0A3P7P9Y7_DIBLA|nr:unnamed protein product [Dibothriocephalus latus]